MDTPYQRRVVCAAIRMFDGHIICGARHMDHIMRSTLNNMASVVTPMEQGFIDQFGTFMTREEAWVVACEAEQIVRRVGGDGGRLFSENLY